MGDSIKYAWQQTVVDAFLSLPPQLTEKVTIAQQTIAARLQRSNELEISERTALDDAQRALRVLSSEANSHRADTANTGRRGSPDHREMKSA